MTTESRPDIGPSNEARERRRIYQTIAADLQPTRAIVYIKVGIAVLVGGLISHFFCGQSGIGFSRLALAANSWIMAKVGGIGCTAFCGALFAVLPPMILRLMTSPLQFRLLFRRDWVALPLWIAAFGAVMGHNDHAGNPLWEALIWTSAGCLTFKAVAFVVDQAAAAGLVQQGMVADRD